MWDLGPNSLRLLYSLKARYSNDLNQIRLIRVLHLTLQHIYYTRLMSVLFNHVRDLC